MSDTTWVLIADASRARLFKHHRAEHTLDLAFEDDRPELREKQASQGDARPGRVHERSGAGRHAMEPHTAADELGRTSFARELVDRLRSGASEHSFDLLLVAPPAMLGSLREQLDAALRERLVGELGKDLTKFPVHELGDHLSDWIAVDSRPDLE